MSDRKIDNSLYHQFSRRFDGPELKLSSARPGDAVNFEIELLRPKICVNVVLVAPSCACLYKSKGIVSVNEATEVFRGTLVLPPPEQLAGVAAQGNKTFDYNVSLVFYGDNGYPVVTEGGVLDVSDRPSFTVTVTVPIILDEAYLVPGK